MDTTKFVDLIEKSHHIGLVLPTQPDIDALASAEALMATLATKSKKVGLLNSTPLENTENFPTLSSAPRLLREFIVTLDTTMAPISQLRYEKHDEKIDIIFSPKEHSPEEKMVSVRQGKVLCDCAIVLGVSNIDSLQNVDVNPEFFTETPLINIDSASDNKHYGEVNLVSEKSSLSEVMYELLLQLNPEPLPKTTSSLLLTAISSKTHHFQTKTTAETLLIASELMRLGAELPQNTPTTPPAAQTEAPEKPYAPPQDISLLQLIGRASVRSRSDEYQKVLWSFLTAEDFEKTSRTPEDLTHVFSSMERDFPIHTLITLIWQDPVSRIIRATLLGSRVILERLEMSGKGNFQRPYLTLSTEYQTFLEAEEHIRALLQEVL